MRTIQVAVMRFGCRGIHSGFIGESGAHVGEFGKRHAANRAKKILGQFDPNGGTIRTRTIARDMNFRCPCGSGKKSRNCCRVAKGGA